MPESGMQEDLFIEDSAEGPSKENSQYEEHDIDRFMIILYVVFKRIGEDLGDGIA